MEEVTIDVTSNFEKVQTHISRETGFYAVVLDVGVDYQVTFSKPGFIPKVFSIDVKDIPQYAYDESFKMFIDEALFPELSGADMTKFETMTMASCKYNTTRDKII